MSQTLDSRGKLTSRGVAVSTAHSAAGSGRADVDSDNARAQRPALYVVATPIGNLNDLSARALEVLGRVDFIVCEDTRQTIKLLQRYEISKPLVSYHQHSRVSRIDEIIQRLNTGQSAALVSDAGTPGIADPGGQLVAAVREKAPGVNIISIPGPAALTAAASVSGLPMDRFLFLGFVPHKKGRQTMIRQIADSDLSVIFYESPHRLMKTLEALQTALAPDRTVVVSRELTKIHEETVSGTASDALKHFQDHPDKVRGEFVVVVGKQ